MEHINKPLLRPQTEPDAHDLCIFDPLSVFLIQNPKNLFFVGFANIMSKFPRCKKIVLLFTPILHKQIIYIT